MDFKLTSLVCYVIISLFIRTDARIIQKGGFSIINQDDAKELAFSVLQQKCNVCHATKKRTDVFTLQNMDSLANDIQRQVFIKKKMPKGKKVKLTPEERQSLKKWLLSSLKSPKTAD